MNKFCSSLYSGQVFHTLALVRNLAPICGIGWFHQPPIPPVINAVRGIAATERDCETRWIEKDPPPPLRLYDNKKLRALINEDVDNQLVEESKTWTVGTANTLSSRPIGRLSMSSLAYSTQTQQNRIRYGLWRRGESSHEYCKEAAPSIFGTAL